MKKIKLIASDIDGTLVKDGSLALNPEYYEVIEQLIASGVTFVACSGRQYISERKLFSPIRDKIMYVTDGGTVIRTSEKILKVCPLAPCVWKGMYQSMEDLPNCDCFICTPDYSLAEDAGSKMFRWLKDSYGYDIREVPKLSEIDKLQNIDVIKFTVYHPDACEEMCTPSFIPKWKTDAKIACAGREWVDCISNDADKGLSIKWLQNYLHISPEETCVFGDNMNDISMFQHAGYSFAVSNARNEVKAAAKGICAPYYEDGVLQELRKIYRNLTIL